MKSIFNWFMIIYLLNNYFAIHILQFKSLPLTISPWGEEVRGRPNCSLSYQILYIHSFKVHTTFFACYVREARDAFVAKVVGDKFLTINDIGTIKDIAHTKLCIFHLHYFKTIPFDVAKATATVGLPRNNHRICLDIVIPTVLDQLLYGCACLIPQSAT